MTRDGVYLKEVSRNVAKGPAKELRKKLAAIPNTSLTCRPYWETPAQRGDTIYCDPPYFGTEGYPWVGEFDHGRFWTWCFDCQTRGVGVVVSEFTVPDDDRIEVLAYKDRTAFMAEGTNKARAPEGLFYLRPSP